MPLSYWPVQEALEVLASDAFHLEFGLRRCEFSSPTRTKAQFFETQDRQLAIMVGRLLANDRFSAASTQLVLEKDRCPSARLAHPQLLFRDGAQLESNTLLKTQGSRLQADKQLLVMVGDVEALRALMHWYCPAVSKPARVDGVQEKLSESLVMNKALNTILYGPPGTGKTYATIDHALCILDPQFASKHAAQAGDMAEVRRAKRKAMKQRFDELAHEKRIRFVTFHQSFSYEDFVEGIRAVSSEEDGTAVGYDVVDGVFKSLCNDARPVVVKELAREPGSFVAGKVIWKMALGENKKPGEAWIFPDCIKKGHVLLGWGAGGDFVGCQDEQDIRQRYERQGLRWTQPKAAEQVADFVLTMKPGDLVIVPDRRDSVRAIGVVTGAYKKLQGQDDYDQCRPVKWLRLFEPSLPHDVFMNRLFPIRTLEQPAAGAINREKLQKLLNDQPEAIEQHSHLPYVLIIDEINRGNVSRIFGELITLVEPGKRTGMDEALEVTLPYSQESFGVPDNVYLLGTMNTADRSLAGLDIALRRRFHFEEMPPRPDLLDAVEVEGVSLGALLRVMNERIEVLLDRDHCLGHAYFMPLADLAPEVRLPALAEVFRRQVLPLLEEYFFEDWERIGWVLNDHRKSNNAFRFVQPSGGNGMKSLTELFGDKADQVQDRRWSLNRQAFEHAESYRQIVHAPAAAA